MAFAISEGAIRGLDRPAQAPATTIRLADDYTADYLELWRTHGSVRTCVSFLARNIAQLGLHVFRRKSDTDRERLTDHALAVMISTPNPWTTRYRLLNGLVHDLAIFDRAYLQTTRSKDGAPGLIRLPPPMVTPAGDEWITPAAFKVKGSRATRTISSDEIVYFRGYSGTDDLGASPIESLRGALSEEYEAGRMREQTLRNGARISGYLERPNEAKPWTNEARERFRTSWRAQYSGGGPESGGTPILEDGMTFNPASHTAKDLQYIEARKLTREEVASAYFIPPPMIGILDNATFSNIQEQHKMLYQDTLGPWLVMIAEELALQLIPHIADSKNVYVEFNLAEKLTGSFDERAAVMTTAAGAPFLTRNEVRAMDNRAPLDGGDELITPLNVAIGGQMNGDQTPNPSPAPPVPDEDPDEDEDTGDDPPADDDEEA